MVNKTRNWRQFILSDSSYYHHTFLGGLDYIGTKNIRLLFFVLSDVIKNHLSGHCIRSLCVYKYFGILICPENKIKLLALSVSWCQLNSVEAIWIRLKSFEVFQSHFKSFEVIWNNFNLFEFSWSHLKLFEVFQSHLKSFETIWIQLKS